MLISLQIACRTSLGFFLLLLAACGGGGGGSSAPDRTFRIVMQTPSISFNFVKGESPTPQTITATWTGQPPDTIYILATVEGIGIQPSIPVTITSSNAVATVYAVNTTDSGTYSGRIIFAVCSDSACTQRIGGTPISVPYTINVEQPVFDVGTSIGFNYLYGTTPSGAVPVPISAAANSWTVTSNSPWIVLSKTSGVGADTVTVNYNPLAVTLSPFETLAVVNGFVQFRSGTLTRSVSVRLAVTKPRFIVTASSPGLTFSAVNGAPIASRSVSLGLSNSATLPLSITSNAPWLKFSTSGATAPQSIIVSVDPTVGPLASGTYTGQLHLVAGNGTNNITEDVPLTLELTKAQFIASSPNVELGGTTGRNFNPVSFTLSLNTGTNQYPWTIATLPSWATIDRTSGSLSSTSQTFTVTPHRLNSTPGTAPTTLQFRATINGDTVVSNIPMTFNLDTHKLIASENGVALVTTPNPSWRRLSHTVKIRSNFGLSVPWTAVSSEPWLTVTPSGTSGGELTLTANTTLIPLNDQLYTATITVSSSDSSIAGSERIRVGLWAGASTFATRQSIWNGFEVVTNNGSPIVADPIRPYAYLYKDTYVQVINLYTQSVVATIPAVYSGVISNPGSADIQALTISSDGDTLYAYDKQDGVIVPIDLTTLMKRPSYPVVNSYGGNLIRAISYVRINGVGVIFGPEKAYVADVGTAHDFGLISGVAAATDANAVFMGSYKFDVDYTSAGGGTFIRSLSPSFLDISSIVPSCCAFAGTVANADASRVYAAIERNVVRFDGLTMTLLPTQINESTANFWNVAVGGNGTLAASSTSAGSGEFDVFVYSSNGSLITKFRADLFDSLSRVQARSLLVSSDGFLVVAGTVSKTLETVPIQ